jgi:hypothetical protein
MREAFLLAMNIGSLVKRKIYSGAYGGTYTPAYYGFITKALPNDFYRVVFVFWGGSIIKKKLSAKELELISFGDEKKIIEKNFGVLAAEEAP